MATASTVPVTATNFARAETDMYFARNVAEGGFGKFKHERQPVAIDKQIVIRMNRDTLYSYAVFDLDAGPVTITLPDSGKRFMSLLTINQDHYNLPVAYAPGGYTYTRKQVGTRYMMVVVRTLANPSIPADVQAANAMQDHIKSTQAAVGKFEVPLWDKTSQDKVREALLVLASNSGFTTELGFGAKGEVDPIAHLILTAAGWGGNPRQAAVYEMVQPKNNDGSTIHELKIKDVPVDGFWSISIYNARGFFEKNDLDSYSLNNLTAKPDSDGGFTLQFGGCTKQTANCLVTPPGWSYVVRMYRPRAPVVSGTWKFPEAQPV
jgi:para-nitrobenzyl esterase